ncbi:hypothetical protein BGX27_011581 [Mortierella sp. AM989]|nr:hypothetical protein BGX27_011581 [Mortierella sp. AM989]
MVDVALSIVNETPTLESLTLSIPRLYGQGQLAWTLMSHKRLRRFTFKISPEVYPDSLQEIVEACSKLEYLCIDTYHQSPPSPYSSYSTDSITRSAVAKKRYENMQDTKIRDLSIDLNHEDLSHNLLISILERCPLLETLWLGGKYKRTTLKDVSDIFERGVCPLLKNVNIEGICETTHTPDELGAFVRSIGSNGRDDIEDDRFGTRGLESLSIFEGAKFGRPTVLALTQYHSKTLTNLMWPHFIPLGISLFGDLLKDLPRLKTLKARVWLNLRVKDGPDMDPVFRKEWNCPELSNLEIDLGLSATFDKTTDQAWSGSLSDRSMSYALSQIAKLKKLKKLVVRSEVELLTLKGPGYLRMLSGLKQLEVLRFDRWSTSDMHAEEAEWMIENWPELISIIPEWRWIPKKSPGSRGKPYDEFTQTLVDLRPRLSID